MISKIAAGALHENHKALVARGPWSFDGLQAARYESRPAEGGGTCEVPVVSGTCDICGSPICDVVRFVSKAGERITTGLDCAATFEHNNGRAFRDAKTGLLKIKREATARRKGEKLAIVLAPLRAEMEGWLASHAGTFHATMAGSVLRVLDKGRRPSPEQMAVVTKLRGEEPRETRAAQWQRGRAAQPVEIHVAAPEGKLTVRGTLVNYKAEELLFGYARRTVYKMTVKVTTEAGVYLVHGTLPQALFDAARDSLDAPDGYCEALKGCEVEFCATLKRSDRDEHFAFAERPSKARLVAWPAEKAKPSEDIEENDATETIAA
jgi:hypothetical protein